MWLDYVADLGDGFDATYAIAYLIAQPRLIIADQELPRGGALIFGGDEVYPTASRWSYAGGLRKPYDFAWPDVKTEPRPPVFALPGNHDWYDGLVVFLAIFCRVKSTVIGNWATRQRRSYFSVKLTDRWWLWGIDIALVRDMDQPQADYFVAAAERMPEGVNIILCSAEPGWYLAESEGDSYRTLGYASSIAKNANRNLRIPLVLSGDSHHYSRYSGAGSEFVTAGGGGAFVHGTLELKPTITTTWLKHTKALLTLRCAYPTKQESRDMLNANARFFALNRQFSYVLGGLYWILAVLLLTSRRFDLLGIEYILFVSLSFSILGIKKRNLKRRHLSQQPSMRLPISW